MDYVMPFLIILCAGVVAVLLFNLVRALFDTDDTRAAYLHIVDGSGEMKAWGTEQYFGLSSDVLVMQGDEIRSSADAKLIVEFFDGTIMRMDGNTVVEFSAIVNEKNSRSIELDLRSGAVWFNKLYKSTENTENTKVSVNAGDLSVRSNFASIYAVQVTPEPAVRVFGVFENEGLMVDILDEDGDRVVETEKVGVGQEMVFGTKVLEKYRQYQSPTVISAVSDEFKASTWYLWNFAEDSEPTQFEKVAGMDNVGLVKVQPELNDDEAVEPDEDVEEPAEAEKPAEAEEPAEAGEPAVVLSKPTISTVAGGTQVDDKGFYNVTGSLATLTGSVSGASKVVVNGYTLQKFNPGDTTWTYFANADYDLMKVGENVYEIYVEDAKGNKSEVLTVKVFYAPPAPVVEAEPVSTDVEEVPGENL